MGTLGRHNRPLARSSSTGVLKLPKSYRAPGTTSRLEHVGGRRRRHPHRHEQAQRTGTPAARRNASTARDA
eukprot:589167-Prymnesium_polylepis.1